MLSRRRTKLKPRRLCLLLDNRTELLVFQSWTADQKKYLIPFHFCWGIGRARGFFKGSKCSLWDSNWKPWVLLPIQPSSSSAQNSSSVERKPIDQRVIIGLISLLLLNSVIQLSGSLLSSAQPGNDSHCCSLDEGLGNTKSDTLWNLGTLWLCLLKSRRSQLPLRILFVNFVKAVRVHQIYIVGSLSRYWVLSPFIFYFCNNFLALLSSMPLLFEFAASSAGCLQC